jgi:hypothetical protein
MSDSLIIEYSGAAATVGAFVQALKEEGLEVRYDRPAAALEERGVPDPQAVAHAYVLIEAWVSDHPLASGAAGTVAVKAGAAIERWRKGRLSRAAEVQVQGGPRHRAP